MGIIKKPSIDMNWTIDPLLETPGIAKIMSRNKYQNILRYLHFCSNSKNNDKISKLRPVLEYILKRFQNVYSC